MADDLDKNQNEILSLAEASKLTGYHQDYLGQLCRAGKLKGTKIGRNWTTTRAALAELQHDMSQEQGAQPVAVHIQHNAGLPERVESVESVESTPPASGPPQEASQEASQENLASDSVAGLPIMLTPSSRPKSNLETVKQLARQMHAEQQQRLAHAALQEKVEDLNNKLESFQITPAEHPTAIVPVVMPLKNKLSSNFDFGDSGINGNGGAQDDEEGLLDKESALRKLYQNFQIKRGALTNKWAVAITAAVMLAVIGSAAALSNAGALRKFFGGPSGKTISYVLPEARDGTVAAATDTTATGSSGQSTTGGNTVLAPTVIVHAEGQPIAPVSEAYVDRLVMVNLQSAIDQGWIKGQPGRQGSVGPAGPNPDFKTGSIVFEGIHKLAEDNLNLFWDNTGKRLGIGTHATPVANLDVRQTANGNTILHAQRRTDTAPTGDFIDYENAAGTADLFRVDNSGNISSSGTISSGGRDRASRPWSIGSAEPLRQGARP